MARQLSRDDAREEARNFLEDHWADSDGIVTFPVDPVAIAKRLSVNVIRAGLETDVSGLLVRESSDDVIKIYLNRHDSEKRQRFTCAHELGHLASRRGEQSERIGYVDSRNDLSSAGTDQDEIYANAFAAELLMPGVAVRKWWAEGMGISRIARIFDVSTAAMEIRLTSLDLK